MIAQKDKKGAFVSLSYCQQLKMKSKEQTVVGPA